jgi:hypothetical protein
VVLPKRKAILGLAAGFLLSLLLVIAFSPHFHDSQGGVRQNESAAVRPAEDKATAYDPTMALLAGEWSGYKFVLAGCTSTEGGIVVRYQITAVPIAGGLTGVRAFCADESGTLFYEESGSPTECLSSRVPVF